MVQALLPPDIPLDVAEKEREVRCDTWSQCVKVVCAASSSELGMMHRQQFPGVFTWKWFGFARLLACHLLALSVFSTLNSHPKQKFYCSGVQIFFCPL